MGMPSELPSMHILDADVGETLPGANARSSYRYIPFVANFRAKPALPVLHSAEWRQDDERTTEGT